MINFKYFLETYFQFMKIKKGFQIYKRGINDNSSVFLSEVIQKV